MTSVAVVIPWRSDDPERIRIFEWVMARWSALHPDWPIVTPHDGATEGPFNRSRAVNRGVDMASGEVVLIADADIAVRHRQAEQMVDALEAGALWVVGFDRMVHVDEHITNVSLNHPADSALSDRFAREYIRWSSTESVCGLVALRRDDYLQIDGNDERFCGWGWEDTAFAAKADTLLGPHARVYGDCVHLFHALRADRKVDDDAKANADLGGRYASARGDAEAMTSLVRESLGA